MSVAFVMSAVALANSNEALALQREAQHRQDVKDCQDYMPSFHDDGASLQQKLYYSACVDLVYPQARPDEPLTPAENVALIALLIVGLIGFIIGAWIGGVRDGNYFGFWDKVLLGTLGGICGSLVGGIIVGVGFLLWIAVPDAYHYLASHLWWPA